MKNCNHMGATRYARFSCPDGRIYYAVQCLTCGQPIKTQTHDGKLRIRHSEIPSGEVVHDSSEALS